MTEHWQQLSRTLRAERHHNVDDELYEAEVSQCRWERAMRNGNGNGKQPEPPRYCWCAELVVNGERLPKPRHHSCEYVAARSALVDEAEARAIKAVGYLNKDNGSAFTRRFNAEMDRLSAHLLRQSSNGT